MPRLREKCSFWSLLRQAKLTHFFTPLGTSLDTSLLASCRVQGSTIVLGR